MTIDPLDRPEAATSSFTPKQKLVVFILLTMLACWFFLPALTSVHVEAFSERLQSKAILDLQHKLALDDQAYPMVTEYLYATRPGTIQALETIMRLTHSRGDANFRILILASYAVFLFACFLFVRRWSDEPLWAAFAVVILTPGLVEITYFFADNLPSAALAMLALALISKRTSITTWLLIGVLLAAAILTRLDAIFAIPSVLVVGLVQSDRRWKRLACQAIAAIAGAAAIFFVSWRFTTVSLRQALNLARFFGTMHLENYSRRLMTLNSLTMFFGLTCLGFLAAGAIRNLRNKDWQWNLCFTLYPALLYLGLITKAFELRDFLLLGAPFIVLQGTSGLRYLLLLATDHDRRKRLFAYASFTLCFIAITLPPRVLVKDGPRTSTGRLWSPLLWREWQSSIADDSRRCQDMIDSIAPGERLLVISSNFEAEANLHLHLLEDGYTLQPFSSGLLYGHMVEVFKKDAKTVFNVQSEAPYMFLTGAPYLLPYGYVNNFQIASSLASLGPANYDRAVLLTWGTIDRQGFMAANPLFYRSNQPMEILLPSSSMPAIKGDSYGKLRILPLSSDDVAALQALTADQVRLMEARNDGTWKPFHSYADFHHLVDSRYWYPGNRSH